jgi:hypothetical protein
MLYCGHSTHFEEVIRSDQAAVFELVRRENKTHETTAQKNKQAAY